MDRQRNVYEIRRYKARVRKIKKLFSKVITLDDLLKRKKVYTFESKYTWDYIYTNWRKKNKEHPLIKGKKLTQLYRDVRTPIIDKYNEIMITDMIMNHTIVELPFKDLYLFVSQKRKSIRKEGFNFKTNMYEVDLQVYYKKQLLRAAAYKFKQFVLQGELRKKLDDCIEKGWKYPLYEDVVKFIEEQTNG